MNKLSILVCFLMASSLVLANSEWQQFKAQHGKTYANPIEEKMRQAIFTRNKDEIERFNEQQSAEAGFQLGLNHLADWTEKEINSMMGFKAPKDHKLDQKNSAEEELFLARILSNRSDPLPDTVDWRATPGRVTPVKDQGQCGSCWAFSATGALEGQQYNLFKDKKLISLSEQNLVDCATDKGCSGSLPSIAFMKIKEEGGIASEISYPYTGRDGNSCRFNKSDAVMTDSGFISITKGDENLLRKMVAIVGPISVGIDASPTIFQFYQKGVYKSTTCKNDDDSIDHAVLIVGYGTEDGKDYWLVVCTRS